VIGQQIDSRPGLLYRVDSPRSLRHAATGFTLPHLIIEYSANIEDRIALDALLDKLHACALETGVFPLGGLRVRAHRADHYRIADKAADNGFVHVTALIGHGRALDVQQRAGEQLFAVLTEHLASLYDRSPLAISLNIQEFHPVLNFKKNNLHEHVKKRGGTARSSKPGAQQTSGSKAQPKPGATVQQ
jgi:5-carboxymethyl-2-hydroxymuconate isomerase